MGYMNANDAISGKEGALFSVINGVREQVLECKNVNAKITKNKAEFKTIGYRGTQHKAIGWSGTGSLVVHYATSKWAKLMINYANKGVDTYFTLQIENEDPTSSIGRQTVILENVNFDESEIAKLDSDADILDQSMNFTFSGAELVESFKALNS